MAKPDPKAPVPQEYFHGMIEHLVEKLGKMMDDRFGAFGKKMDKGFSEAKAERQDLKRQINDLKMDTTTPKEFNELKTKVEHHPTN